MALCLPKETYMHYTEVHLQSRRPSGLVCSQYNCSYFINSIILSSIRSLICKKKKILKLSINMPLRALNESILNITQYIYIQANCHYKSQTQYQVSILSVMLRDLVWLIQHHCYTDDIQCCAINSFCSLPAYVRLKCSVLQHWECICPSGNLTLLATLSLQFPGICCVQEAVFSMKVPFGIPLGDMSFKWAQPRWQRTWDENKWKLRQDVSELQQIGVALE